MSKNNDTVGFLTQSALIAAAYAAATLLLAPFSFGPVQVRLSESLTLLPMLTGTAVPGLTLGCLLSNGIGMAMGQTQPVDMLFGTAATLIAAAVTRKTKDITNIKGISVIGALSPVIFNALIVGLELTLFFGGGTFPYCAGFVAIGETAAVLLGIPLLLALRRTKVFSGGEV